MNAATMKPVVSSRSQRGFLLIEGLVAILIFSLGILGMIAMASTAISAQSDAHYRTDAARLADDITNIISVSVDRTNKDTVAATLAPFQHQPGGTVADCAFSGTPSASLLVTRWVTDATTPGPGLPGLPGAGAANQQIKIETTDTGGLNRVEVSVCWRAPGTPAATPPRHHTVVTYIN